MSRCLLYGIVIFILAMTFTNVFLLLEMRSQVESLTKKVYQLEFSRIGVK